MNDIVLPAYAEAIKSLPGLVGWFRMGEASGAVVDSIGSVSGSTSGTVTRNAPGLLAYDFDGSIDFDGSTGYVDLGDNYDFAGTLPMSIGLWFHPDTLPGSAMYLATKTPGATTNGSWSLNIGATNAVTFLRQNNTGSDSVSTSGARNVVAGGTYFAVATYDGRDMLLYLNGGFVSSAPSSKSLANNTTTVKVGRVATASSGFFDGRVDEVSFWNRALSGAEIEWLYWIGRGT